MPLTFIDIERQKNWRIAVFFSVLLLLYLAVISLLGAVFLPLSREAGARFWTFAVLASLLTAGIHFWFSASDTVNTVMQSLGATPPDDEDGIHRTFANIIEEVHVVTGNARRIQCAVIPSLSLNALAAADLKGNALIAVTEGLLSRLARPQLEAVVAHEAHHVLSGDCLETTVAASLFGTLSSAMDKLRYSFRSRGFGLPVLLLAWVLLQFGNLLNLFISRQREYRADAAAVRMTRNPLALAEALHLLSRSWRGAGFIGSGFQTLCIVNPQATALDETEGFFADLLSTHPPLGKRMEVLLSMARVPLRELESRAQAKAAPANDATAPIYHALSPAQQWEGPFTAAELALLPWLGPLTWVLGGSGSAADRAWKEPALNALFLSRLGERADAGVSCPSCRQPLVVMPYEGTQTFRCAFCGGTLVRTELLPRIIARTAKEDRCTDRIKSLARTMLRENQARRAHRAVERQGKSAVPALSCPRCANPMHRGFYSMSYLVEVDRCSNCGITWFERDELEMLQCMIEHRLAPETGGGA